MRAHIQKRNGRPATTSGYCAYPGFKDMGIETTIFPLFMSLKRLIKRT